MAQQSRRNRGCFSRLKFIWNIVFLIILLGMISFNVVFSNIVGETCGFIHPLIFEVEASVVDDAGRSSSVDYTRFPFDDIDVARFFDFEASYEGFSADESDSGNDLIDTYLRIYDASGGTLLAENDDDPEGGTFNSVIRGFGLNESAEIIIEVATFGDSYEGGYTLAIEQTDGQPQEPFNGRAERIENVFDPEIELDSTGDEITDIIFSDERIIYTMQAQAGQAYNITLEATQLIGEDELDTYLRVYNEDVSVLLAENDDDGFGFGSTIPDFGVDETQTVIIEVATFFDEMGGDFTLVVTPIGGDYFSDASDPEPIDAVILDSSPSFDAEGGVVGDVINSGERLRYRFTAEGGQAYEITVSGVNGASDAAPRTQGYAENSAWSASPGAASEWAQCLQYFGYVNDGNYVLNENGLIWFIVDSDAEDKLFDTCAESVIPREFLEQCVRSSIRLSSEGRMLFFVLLAILVVSLPIFIVDALEGQRELTWYIFLMLVVVQATTTAMLFLHLGQVSGIAALEEFGYGIFGGITTGAALVFIDKVASRAQDNSSRILGD